MASGNEIRVSRGELYIIKVDKLPRNVDNCTKLCKSYLFYKPLVFDHSSGGEVFQKFQRHQIPFAISPQLWWRSFPHTVDDVDTLLLLSTLWWITYPQKRPRAM